MAAPLGGDITPAATRCWTSARRTKRPRLPTLAGSRPLSTHWRSVVTGMPAISAALAIVTYSSPSTVGISLLSADGPSLILLDPAAGRDDLCPKVAWREQARGCIKLRGGCAEI